MARGLIPDQAAKGLIAFRKKFDVEQKAAFEAAVKIVEPAARRNLAKQSIPNRPGSIEARKGLETGIRIRYNEYPWMAGAEIGSKRFRQFKRYVGLDRGYIVGAAIRSTEQAVGRAVVKHMESELKEELV